jgi:hypothetical protein
MASRRGACGENFLGLNGKEMANGNRNGSLNGKMGTKKGHS